ncbi:MAG TPA: class I SAM-dependent methyltransferase [Planctomycetaceae bacterium]|nr:class I SAM-dependent methyltransferase [Planctomycetaceae bacterium]
MLPMQVNQNPFDDPRMASHYEAWYAEKGRRASRLEKRLLGSLIRDFPSAKTILEVGCGTGHFTRWMTTQGLTATGLDSSPPMIVEANRLGGAKFLEGNAMALPFADSEFDLASFITTLEFVANPELALAEAVRVAKQGLLLGVLNRHSLLAARHRYSGKAHWKSANFITVNELTSLVSRACADRIDSIRWQTTLWPIPLVTSLPLPWGGFIGISIRLLKGRVTRK